MPREGVQDQQAARARAAEAGQALDVGAQQRVDLGQRPRQHGGDLAREGLTGPRRIAVADQHEIGERPQLARGGERDRARSGPTAARRLADPVSRGRTTRRPGAPGPREPSRPRARSPRWSARPRCAAARRRRRAPRGIALAHRAQRCEAPPAEGGGHLHLPSSDAIVSRNPGATPSISGSYPMEHSWNPWVQPAPCRVRIRFSNGVPRRAACQSAISP